MPFHGTNELKTLNLPQRLTRVCVWSNVLNKASARRFAGSHWLAEASQQNNTTRLGLLQNGTQRGAVQEPALITLQPPATEPQTYTAH